MNRKNLCLAGALAACAFQPAQAGIIVQSEWIGPGEGNWSIAEFWSPFGVPNNHDNTQYAVTIANGSNVFLNQNATIGALTLAAKNQLTINNSRRLEVSVSDRGGIINNAGVIRINAGASNTYLQPVGGLVSLTGGGTIELSDSPNNWIYRGDASGALLNVDNTIRGSGNLGWNSSPTDILNQGTIIADGAVALVISGHSANGFRNEGLVEASGAGGITSTGANFTNAGQILVNSGSSFTRAGNLTQTSGSTTVNGVLAVNNGSLLVQGGTLKGSGQVSGQINNTGGLVEPGASVGTLTVNGSYTQASDGALHIELGGSESGGEHDQLIISGSASLAGTLQISLVNCELTVGQEFVVLTSGALTGQFSAVEGPAGLHVIYSDQSVTVKVVEEICPADVSCDGMVNVEDLLAVINTWGACATVPCLPSCVTDIAPPGGDCMVNVSDLLMVITNWGNCP